MSYSKFATQADREARILSAAIKPVVKIKEVTKVLTFGDTQPDYYVLFGVPIDHPRSSLNGQEVRTSKILSVDGNTVETNNTIYLVQNWL